MRNIRRINVFLVLALLLGQVAGALPSSAHNSLMAGQTSCAGMDHVKTNTPSQTHHSQMQGEQAGSDDCCNKTNQDMNCMLDCLSTCTVFLTALQEAPYQRNSYPSTNKTGFSEVDTLLSRTPETSSPPPKA